MIKTLEIENFKSIKHLKLDCKKINIFIGEPNTGKSNILETLGILSFGGYKGTHENHIGRFVRFERISNLFYDENLDKNIRIIFNNKNLVINFYDGSFTGQCHGEDKTFFGFKHDYSGSGGISRSGDLSFIKFYRFISRDNFPTKKSEFLFPPSGENLLSVILKHKGLKSIASQIFGSYGLSLGLRPQDNKIEVFKQDNDVFIFYPYSLVSDTLQRIIFYLAAIYSNEDSVIAFEEPESHAFPYYTKYLAEIIAQNENNNQYFITTHNPYLLLSILEKAPKDDVGIFIAYFEDYQTKVKPLSEKEKQEIMDMEIDVFFNIDRFLEKQ